MTVNIQYRISMPFPQNHRFHVRVEVTGWEEPEATLVLPVWTPGSYLVREFARHVESFRVFSTDGRAPPVERRAKSTWVVETVGVGAFCVAYDVYANDLTVRTSYLDETHGYFNGANVFVYLDGYIHLPVALRIEEPPGWRTSIALSRGDDGLYHAASYDVLVDSPAEIGTHRLLRFEALGKPHEIALWGHGNEDEEALRRDFKAIVEGVAGMFGDELPYDRYLFIVHLGDKLGGGLEHRDSTTLAVDRWTFQPPTDYDKFLRLATHEFFHVWNVKRIRPYNLGPFDYTQEVYTPLLWVMEGFTTYYDLVLHRRSGLLSPTRMMELLAERVSTYLQQPGRLIQSLEESSLTTWIKFYRQDENYVNSGISYYLKGGLVALVLDMWIRRSSGNQRSLDDVLRGLWRAYGARDVGFTEQQFYDMLDAVAGAPMADFLDRFVRGLEELPLEDAFDAAGMRMDVLPALGAPSVWFGVRFRNGDPGLEITHVLRDTSGEAAGLMPGDQIIALDGYRAEDEEFLRARLREKHAGQQVVLHLFRQGILLEKSVLLEETPKDRARLSLVASPTSLQRAIWEGWMASDWPG